MNPTITPDAANMVFQYNWSSFPNVLWPFFLSVFPVVLALMIVMMCLRFISMIVWGGYRLGKRRSPVADGN